MMKLPKELTTVTKLSKYLAMILFIALPFVGFLLGMRYQEMMNLSNRQEMETNLTISHTPTLTPEDSANWKTYTSQPFKFSILYPSALEYKEIVESSLNDPAIKNVPTVRFTDEKDPFIYKKDLSEFPNIIFIRIFDRDKVSLDQIERAYFTIEGDKWKETPIGDYQGRYIEASGGLLGGIAALLEFNDKIFYFHLADRFDDEHISNYLFFQILSTFKFTSP